MMKNTHIVALIFICTVLVLFNINASANTTVDRIQNAVSNNCVTEYVEVPIVVTEYVDVPGQPTEADMYEMYLGCLTDFNHKDWYLGYKVMSENWHDKQTSIYDVFTDEELDLLFRTVETEVHGGDFDSKTHVASVIFNRLISDKWGNNLKAVLTAPNQFVINQTVVDEETILACEFAYMIDTAQGCLYFHSGGLTSTFSGGSYVFTDNVSHHFYR